MKDKLSEYTSSNSKSDKPKIMLLDMDESMHSELTAKGYDVISESSGLVVAIGKSADLVPVNVDAVVSHEECEIIVVDIASRKLSDSRYDRSADIGMGVRAIWTSCESGIIDRKPLFLRTIHKSIDKILAHGGVLVLFSSPRKTVKYSIGRSAYLGIDYEGHYEFSNWDITSAIMVNTKASNGKEMRLATSETSPLGKLLKNHMADSLYDCSLCRGPNDEVLVENKYGEAVSAIIRPHKGGTILIFPRIERRTEFVSSLVAEVLPDIVPALFPIGRKNNWQRQSPYELEANIKLRAEIDEIRKESDLAIAERESQMSNNIDANQYVYDLLTESGDALVNAVIKSLEKIGFTKIIDVDRLQMNSGESTLKREDLRIEDRSPTLLVEVKGVGGYPSEAEVLQVQKYILPRIIQQNRTDIRGLSIFNYQRHLPPLERELRCPFSADSLINAKQSGFGVIAAWDFFRLVRGFIKNNWQHSDVADVLYRVGRIDPIPTHYEYIGNIEQFWPIPRALSITLVGNAKLKIRDRIAFELAVDFEEEEVASLRIEGKPVTEATGGQVPGIKTRLNNEQARPGVRVFRIIPRSGVTGRSES